MARLPSVLRASVLVLMGSSGGDLRDASSVYQISKTPRKYIPPAGSGRKLCSTDPGSRFRHPCKCSNHLLAVSLSLSLSVLRTTQPRIWHTCQRLRNCGPPDVCLLTNDIGAPDPNSFQFIQFSRSLNQILASDSCFIGEHTCA